MRKIIFLIITLWACEPQKQAPMTRAEKIKAQFSGWDGSHINLTKVIKEKMNDPASYEHIETRFEDKDEYVLVVTKFRGNNEYGGKVINLMFAQVTSNGDVLETSDHDVWAERMRYLQQTDEIQKLDSSRRKP